MCEGLRCDLPSLPTRRSSDLIRLRGGNSLSGDNSPLVVIDGVIGADLSLINPSDIDRKSTRLNSSHRCISYGVLCLKKAINIGARAADSTLPEQASATLRRPY